MKFKKKMKKTQILVFLISLTFLMSVFFVSDFVDFVDFDFFTVLLASSTENQNDFQSDEHDEHFEEQKKQENLIVTMNGKLYQISAIDWVANQVESEMGPSFPVEALKAQAIVTHTFSVRNQQNKAYPRYVNCPISQKVWDAVKSVSDLILVKSEENRDSMNRLQVAFTPYCSCSAGQTNNAKDIWGFEETVSVESKYDYLAPVFNRQCRYSLEEVRELFKTKWNLELSDVEPMQIFKVLTLTQAGYNGKMSVGPYTTYFRKAVNKEVSITARLIREEVLTRLSSPKFKIFYNQDTQEFIFNSYGYGHGAGMSQYGAKFYAEKENWSCFDITNHYFPNTKVVDLKNYSL